MLSHCSTAPFHNLPPSVVDAIFEQLSTLSLYHCSLVCKCWRHVPYTYIYQLSVGKYGLKLPADSVRLCRNLRGIHVSSSSTTRWPDLAQELTQRQLTNLQELHIQHSSHSTERELQQLQEILQVQGPQCRLYLAVTDKPSLQTLLDLLPIQGLVQLDLNVPYLPEGAADLLTQAARTHIQDRDKQQQQQHQQCNQHWEEQQQPLQQHMEQQHHQNGQQQFSIGVWVCCWGGCPGLDLQAAAHIYQQLQAAGCQMHSCESINCSSSSDVRQLAHFQGMKAVGFNYNHKADGGGSSSSRVADAVAQPESEGRNGLMDTTNTGRSSTRDGAATDANTAALAALVSLKDSLQQLTIHGCPMGGFAALHAAAAGTAHNVSSSEAVHAAETAAREHVQAAGHPLAALTGLTKLSLLKQWGSQPPLPISPISHLTQLRELAVERHRLSHPCELQCLSVLTGLKVLSLTLAIEAEHLQDELQQGRWPAVAMSDERRVCQLEPVGVRAQRQQQQQQQEEEADPQGQQAATHVLSGQFAQLAVQEAVGIRDMVVAEQQGCSGSLVPAPDAVPAIDPDEPCTCFCSMDSALCRANLSSLDTETQLLTTKVAAALPSRLLGQLQCCGCGAVVSPVLIDWSWLMCLKQLEVAWLQVPHLDLACLPSSLMELNAQQPHDLTPVSITCSRGSSHTGDSNKAGSSSSSGVWLPNMKRLVLPRTLQVVRFQKGADSATGEGAGMSSAAATGDLSATRVVPDATLAGDMTPGNMAVESAEGISVSEFSSDLADDVSSADTDGDQVQMQLHHTAAIMLQLTLGCPELRELGLVQWQLPAAAVLSAVQHWRYLRSLSIGQPDEQRVSDMLQAGVRIVRDGNVTLELQEQLILSRYPWSSVLDQR